MATVYPVNLINVAPSQTAAERDALLGPGYTGATPTCAATCARWSLWKVHWDACLTCGRAGGRHSFAIDDVADGIVAKLVRRHPHVLRT